MFNSRAKSIRTLSGVSLLVLLAYLIASQRFALPHDQTVLELLARRHYDLLIAPGALAWVVVSTYVLLVLGLAGLIGAVRWARWVLLSSLILTLCTSIVAGVGVTTPLHRTLGVVLSLLVTAILVLSFLEFFGAASNQRLERP
jgi:hypothetical protein